ncbi:MAG TPA: RNA polymerase sigma factor [Candidatus Hydrogenedentes bacterium]|nr:RNA polymerase sigma factor [Candidatus Hydrogenedentota bacterium]HOJ70149.1 RNA polymerase sigma factor [Candidatus Hydrogenedentota bacterium]HOK89927.1 RNA polymerase sigma factor [Candidatus Hydrogenedentota bacterium]HOV61164.1 RNA polymerase sigma factor [Candidatus Hydrogenedentota bacterium]
MSRNPMAAALPVSRVAVQEADDIQLVQRAKDGDTAAFSELVRRHQDEAYTLAYRFMRDSALAEDMAQEAFLKAFRLLQSYRGECSFRTWMYRVVSSVCLTELRRRKNRHEVEWNDSLELSEERPVVDRDLHEKIRGCVRLLPERYATVISMYYLAGAPYEEIADALNIPQGTLKTWMFRARKLLRQIVEKELKIHGWTE